MVQYSQGADKDLEKDIEPHTGVINDSADLFSKVREIERLVQAYGYLLSSGQLGKEGEDYRLSIDLGEKLYARKIAIMKPDDLIIPERTAIPDREKLLIRGKISQLAEQELNFLENHGYPFARIKVKEFEVISDSANVVYEITPGPRISIDSIVIKGFDGFPENFLRYDLELKPGMAYNEELLSALPEKASRMEYLRMSRKPALAFTKSRTVLFLYLEKVPGNQVDGVIGINTTPEGEVSFNGDFHLRLLNTLKKGENIELRWRRPDQSVQSLNLNFSIPYLFRTPVGLITELSIFRQDSSFVNTSFRGLFSYTMQSGSFINAGIDLKSSNVLADNQLGFNSYATNLFKIGIEINKTNRAIVPTRGYRWQAYGSTGQRKTSEQIQDQQSMELRANYYLNKKRHVLALKLNSEALFGDGLFLNEIFRIGGLKSLRGFNEQSIFSSAYAITTLEYRYMIGEYDYLTLFTDVAWSETNTVNNYASDLFTGIGTGINFNTAGGIFSFFVALGKDQQNPFDLRTTKVHFGYISRF